MVSQERQGLGTLAYPFYVADYAAEPRPTPTEADATLFVLETRQTFVWRSGAWTLFDDKSSADLTTLRQAVDAAPMRMELLMLRELRRIAVLLAANQGIPALFEPLPELDGLTVA